jgi:hypothetical protein
LAWLFEQLRHALGIARGMRDGGRAADRDAEHGVAAKIQCIDDGPQIALERREGDIGDIAIGESEAAPVVADELEPVGREVP